MNEFEIGKPSTGRREGAMEASKDRGGRPSGMSWLGAWSKPGGRRERFAWEDERIKGLWFLGLLHSTAGALSGMVRTGSLGHTR